MKAAASCLLDIHGQHEHQSLLYQDKQLEILDAYGKDEIYPARDKVQEAYRAYRKCMQELKKLDTDEEQRNRERAFLELRSTRSRQHSFAREKTKSWKLFTVN